MDYAEALKTVQAPKKARENYLAVTFNYNTEYLLPYKDGIALMAALANAEKVDDGYSDTPPKISALTKEDIRVTPLSVEDYQKRKMAQLMGIPLRDCKDPSEIPF